MRLTKLLAVALTVAIFFVSGCSKKEEPLTHSAPQAVEKAYDGAGKTESTSPRSEAKDHLTPKSSRSPDFTISVGNTKIAFMHIPSGSFTMGNVLTNVEDSMEQKVQDERPIHDVTVTSYYLGQFEVTQGQWREVMGFTPPDYVGSEYPMTRVTWYQAQEFLRRFHNLTGLQGRLPTEAEWEYAARNGGQDILQAGGAEVDTPNKYGVVQKVSPVGSYGPNEFGLYDMSGGVWEWCTDWYGPYSPESVINPQGPETGDRKVIRGGPMVAVDHEVEEDRVMNRASFYPGDYFYRLGFRLALSTNERQTGDSDEGDKSNLTREKKTVLVGSKTIEMNFVQGGTYLVGDMFGNGQGDELPMCEQKIGPFYMAKYETEQDLWKEVMGTNPSSFSGGNQPVEMVSWKDVHQFIEKLNNLTGEKFRLPTEAEWEYAASGGEVQFWFPGSEKVEMVGWYSENSNQTTHPVGKKAPNGFGLFDMAGNVWEWCSDTYGGYIGWLSRVSSGHSIEEFRVKRGGSWASPAMHLRRSNRHAAHESDADPFTGFRLALSLTAEEQAGLQDGPAKNISIFPYEPGQIAYFQEPEMIRLPAGEVPTHKIAVK